MTLQKRIMNCLLIEEIKANQVAAKKLGLEINENIGGERRFKNLKNQPDNRIVTKNINIEQKET